MTAGRKPPREKFVRQYGLQRSGTCYTQWLLEHNYAVKVLNSNPDKHTPPRYPPLVPTVLSVKHPLSWGVSIYKYYMKREKRGIPTRFPAFVMSVAIPAWNVRMAQFLLMTRQLEVMAIVRAEDLVTQPRKVISAAAEHLGLKRTAGKFKTSNKDMRPIHGGQESGRKFDRTRYTKKKWMDKYDKKLLARAVKAIDPRLLKAFGYKKNGGC